MGETGTSGWGWGGESRGTRRRGAGAGGGGAEHPCVAGYDSCRDRFMQYGHARRTQVVGVVVARKSWSWHRTGSSCRGLVCTLPPRHRCQQ